MYIAYVKRGGDLVEAFILGPHAKLWEASAWRGRDAFDQQQFETGAEAIRWAHQQGACRITIVGIPPARPMTR